MSFSNRSNKPTIAPRKAYRAWWYDAEQTMWRPHGWPSLTPERVHSVGQPVDTGARRLAPWMNSGLSEQAKQLGLRNTWIPNSYPKAGVER